MFVPLRKVAMHDCKLYNWGACGHSVGSTLTRLLLRQDHVALPPFSLDLSGCSGVSGAYLAEGLDSIGRFDELILDDIAVLDGAVLVDILQRVTATRVYARKTPAAAEGRPPPKHVVFE